jgi:hypothetical protein
LPTALQRLQRLLHNGLGHTAVLWPVGRAAYHWVQRVAARLAKATALEGAGGKRHVRAWLGAMTQRQHRRAPTLAARLAHFPTGTRSDWPGLFHCDHIAERPRTNNALEQLFGAQRYHARRATGRKGAAPALVWRGAVRLAACAATRIRPFAGEELALGPPQKWKALRQQLEGRRQQRVRRSRFRRHPEAYLAALERDLLQLILPP